MTTDDLYALYKDQCQPNEYLWPWPTYATWLERLYLALLDTSAGQAVSIAKLQARTRQLDALRVALEAKTAEVERLMAALKAFYVVECHFEKCRRCIARLTGHFSYCPDCCRLKSEAIRLMKEALSGQ